MAELSLSSTEDPATVLKNAKSSLKALEESLKTKDPWDRDVEFHRRNARRQFLHLIFAFPYSPQTLAMDNPIWLETSHRCIAAYRARITAVDDAVTTPSSRAKADTTNGETPKNGGDKGKKPDSGPVELRRLIHRFRQFLADEEKFWTAFILRIARSFDLHEAGPYLEALQLSADDGTAVRTSAFPEERDPMAPPPDQREKKIASLVKAIVSLGDLARYKEQYNERQGRPKAGSEDLPVARWATTKGNGGNRRAGEELQRPRNYTRAMACYTQARLLYPESGHAFHQMAILCSYQADYFGQILNYYRSLCVEHPFTTASDNLVHLLTKLLEASKSESMESASDEEIPRTAIDRFKRDIVKLHALWRAKRASETELVAHTQHTLARFNKLLYERILPIGLIIKIYIAALGAHRTISILARKLTGTDAGKRTKVHAQKMEGVVLTHIMELHLVLVKLATEQLAPEVVSPGVSPPERITAVLRRILQTLRVASKWLIGNQDYLYRAANPEKSPQPGLTRVLGEFWPAYAQFATALSSTFPKDVVKDIQRVQLEEDVEFAGFTPLKKLLKPPEKLPTGIANQAHPNDEYLLRIRDILKDLFALVKSNVNPLKYQGGVYMSKTELFKSTAETSARSNDILSSINQNNGNGNTAGHLKAAEDDDIASVSTEDPVTMAMRTTLELSGNDLLDEMDDEQILVQPGAFSRMDAPYDATPMHGPRLSLSGPSIAPPRDPYAFNLSDLALHPEFNQPYVSQLHPSHYDVFGPTGPSVANVPHPFPPMGTVGSTSGSALFYQDQAPFSRPIGTISPPRASQMLFSSPRHAAGTIGPPPPVGGGLGQDFSTPTSHGYANEHPVSPVRMPHRLSVSANTPTLSRLPLEAAASGSSSSPPRTAQDLLMRVLGTANTPGVGLGSGPGVIGSPVKPPGAIGGATSSGGGGGGGGGGGVRSPRGSTSPPRGGNDRLEDVPPLIFGTMNGQSIWAP